MGDEMIVKDKIRRLVDLVYEVNEKTDNHVFLNISGHVKQVSVHGYKGQFEKYKKRAISFEFYWDKDFTKEYEDGEKVLLGLLKEGDIDD